MLRSARIFRVGVDLKNDYRLFAKWTDARVSFVVRMQDHARFEVIEEREPPRDRGILKDQIIRLTGAGAQESCPHLLRRIEAVREETGEVLVLLTNDRASSFL